MRTKTIQCVKCKAADFRLTLKIYDSNKRNEMVVGCVSCGHSMIMKVGDKK